MSEKPNGFTLIELLIAIAIVGILTSIALPAYQNYTRKAHYTQIVQAAAPFKLGVEECFQVTGELSNCQAGKHGVPKNIDVGVGLVSSIVVNGDGIITVTPNDLYGIKPIDTYVLTPQKLHDQLVWIKSGGGVDLGYAK